MQYTVNCEANVEYSMECDFCHEQVVSWAEIGEGHIGEKKIAICLECTAIMAGTIADQ